MKTLPAQGILLSVEEEAGQLLALAGLRLTEFRVNSEPVEISGAVEQGWRRYLSEAGRRSVSLAADGMVLHQSGESRLRELAISGRVSAFVIDCEGGASLRGPFLVTRLAISDRYGDEASFRLELESSGEVTVS